MSTYISYFPEGPKAYMPRNQQYLDCCHPNLKNMAVVPQLCPEIDTDLHIHK